MECSAADPAHFAEILNPTFTRVTELHLLKGFRQPPSIASLWRKRWLLMRTYYKKLFAWGEGDSGGHVLQSAHHALVNTGEREIV
jgi:hypothetical protein